MALDMSPWLGLGCGRRTRTLCSFGGPANSLFTDLVVLKVPLQQRQPCAAGPVSNRAMSNAPSNAPRAVQWAETAEDHIFKLRLPGLKKEDLHIQIEDDRTLYISYNNQARKEDAPAKEGDAAATEQTKELKPASCSIMRKFKLPENAALEHIKADITNETLTVTVPKRKMKSPEFRKIDVSEGGAATNPHPSTSSGAPSKQGKAADKSKQAKPSTPTA